MFLQLAHNKLDIVNTSLEMVREVYALTRKLPAEEKFNLNQQLRRAATSVYLNVMEGCSRKSLVERCRFFEIARGSIIETDACLDILVLLHYSTKEDLSLAGNLLVRIFQMLSGLIKNKSSSA